MLLHLKHNSKRRWTRLPDRPRWPHFRPANARQRDAWRAKLAGRSRTRAVFVVARARSPGQQQALELEHNQFGDLLQAGVQVSLYLWFSIS